MREPTPTPVSISDNQSRHLGPHKAKYDRCAPRSTLGSVIDVQPISSSLEEEDELRLYTKLCRVCPLGACGMGSLQQSLHSFLLQSHHRVDGPIDTLHMRLNQRMLNHETARTIIHITRSDERIDSSLRDRLEVDRRLIHSRPLLPRHGVRNHARADGLRRESSVPFDEPPRFLLTLGLLKNLAVPHHHLIPREEERRARREVCALWAVEQRRRLRLPERKDELHRVGVADGLLVDVRLVHLEL
mmetsp:Transcript_37395/g.91099  ORF Transcript_37395/g.91099 Transcript_37395/m.91099 type:complete len:244 (-) Transcript_37395:36-767(-)